MAFIEYNPNPSNKRIGDCSVRSICKALNLNWESAFLSMCVVALQEYDMPSANIVWGSLLNKNGFKRFVIANTCPLCTTVREFADQHPDGTYVVACDNSHVVTIVDGDYYDSWDSGDCVVMYYFKKDEV